MKKKEMIPLAYEENKSYEKQSLLCMQKRV